MTEREKVIKGIEHCVNPCTCSGCPYIGKGECVRLLMEDAHELLEEQEPRVLTLKEVKKLQSIRDGAIWLETFGNGLFPALPEFSAGGVTFFVAILFDGYRSVFDNDWYSKTWRCWSAKPTDEQRGAVPWG